MKFNLSDGRPVELKKMTPEDYDAVHEYLQRLIEERLFSLRYVGTPKLTQEVFSDCCYNPNRFTLCIYMEGKIISMAMANIEKPHHAWEKHIANYGMHILKKYIGLGIGSRLLGESEKWLKQNGITKMEVKIRLPNDPTIEIYKNHGYEIEGIRKKSNLIDGRYYDECYIAKIL